MRKPGQGPAFQAEMVALARLVGAEAAAQGRNVTPGTIRKWMARDGHSPAPTLPMDRLEAIAAATIAGVEKDLAEGRLTTVQRATVHGIMRRVIRDERKAARQSDELDSAIAARDRFADWILDAEIFEDGADADECVSAIRFLMSPGLLVLANREAGRDGPEWDPDNLSPHRRALLAWHSGRPEVPAGDVLEWAQEQTLALVKEHGGLVAWHRWRLDQDAAEKAEREAKLMKEQDAKDLVARLATEEATLVALLPTVGEETQIAIEAALAWAREVQKAIAQGDEEAKAILLADGTETLAALGVQ